MLKYKVGKGKERGKPTILNRMIKEGVMDKRKHRPKRKVVRYIRE